MYYQVNSNLPGLMLCSGPLHFASLQPNNWPAQGCLPPTNINGSESSIIDISFVPKLWLSDKLWANEMKLRNCPAIFVHIHNYWQSFQQSFDTYNAKTNSIFPANPEKGCLCFGVMMLKGENHKAVRSTLTSAILLLYACRVDFSKSRDRWAPESPKLDTSSEAISSFNL